MAKLVKITALNVDVNLFDKIMDKLGPAGFEFNACEHPDAILATNPSIVLLDERALSSELPSVCNQIKSGL